MADIDIMVDQLVQRGLTLHRAGRPEMAEAMYRMVLQHDPGNDTVGEALALARLQQSDRDGARDYLARLLATRRADPQPWLILGAFEQSQGQTGLARTCFRRAATLAPDLAEAWRREGIAASHDHYYAEAIRALTRATVVDPGETAAFHALGEIFLAFDQPGQAITHFAAGLTAADSADGHAGLGRALLALGNAPAALVEFDATVGLSPDGAEGWLGAADALRAMGRNEDAAARLTAMAGRFAGRVDELFRLGARFLELGRDDEAMATYRAVLAASDDRKRFPAAGPKILQRRHARELCADKGWPYRQVAPARHASFVDDTGHRHDVRFPEVFLARVDGAEIVTRNGTVICGDTLLADGLLHYPAPLLHSQPEFPWHSAQGRILADLPPPAAEIGDEAILLGGVDNWAHSVQEWLSRLTVLERFPELDGLPILVSPHLLGSIRDLIGLLGIDPARLVTLPDVPVIRVGRLWIPSLTHHHKFASPLHIDFLRRRLGPWIARGMRQPRRRLFIVRRNAAFRELLNEQEILEALAPLGVEAVVPQNLSMEEQIVLFASAELVLFTIGASNAAILFSPPGTAVVELTHSQLVIPQYAMLTATLNQRYRQVVGRTHANRGSTTYDFDFSVRVPEVVATVRHLLEANEPAEGQTPG
jgi:capsular polysaccharide biosynthesis protein/thioredoxin-like negative regulator of GroEL